MANEVLTATTSGCPTSLANGSVGQYLGIGANGSPAWLINPGGPSTDADNVLLTGSDGKVYLSCEEIQDCIGTAIAAGLGLTYNDALNAISGALAIPITSGNGAPAATANSPTIYTDNVTGNIYYRDSTGAITLIGSGTQTPLTVNDSSTIDFTASGINSHTLTASVLNDPTGGLTANANGEAIKLAPAQGGVANAIQLLAAGAYVPSFVVDPSTCNGLVNGANGFLVAPPTYVRKAYANFPLSVATDVSSGFPGQDLGVITVRIDNPSTCLSMEALFNANASGKIVESLGAAVGIYTRLSIDLNGTVTAENVVKGHSGLAFSNEAARINSPLFDADAPVAAITRVFTIPPSGYLSITMAVTAFYFSGVAHTAGNNATRAEAEATLFGVNTN